MASEHAEAVAEFVTAGLAALAAGYQAAADEQPRAAGADDNYQYVADATDRSAADVNFRHAVHLCGNAADVVEEIIRQTGGTLP